MAAPDAMDRAETPAEVGLDFCRLEIVARLRGDMPHKFGIPRQAGLAGDLESLVVFEPAYRNPEALRGLEGFSHIWLLWLFSENTARGFCPTVRPPRLGGNIRLGVFATRSPNRPNPIGLSCVRLLGIERRGDDGMVLRVAGADIADNTPIIDVKPYVPYADAVPDALGGFAGGRPAQLSVHIPEHLAARLPQGKVPALESVLANDPRPAYQKDPERVYAMDFAGATVRFLICDDGVHVLEIVRA